MKKVTLFALLAAITLFINCATVHNGEYAIPVDQKGHHKIDFNTKTGLDLIISSIEYESLSSKYFGVINITFENKSDEWVKIKKIIIDFGNDDKNKNIKITSGNELHYWAKSISKKREIAEFNKKIILGSIGIIGLGVAGGTKNSNLKNIGSALFLGAATSLAVTEYNRNLNKIQNPRIFPENHLLSANFAIPPGLFVKKWIVLNSKNYRKTKIIDKVYLRCITEEGKSEKFKLVFRNFIQSNSLWQADLKN
jgi:hypothetical protein